jgi:hypothetical protein
VPAQFAAPSLAITADNETLKRLPRNVATLLVYDPSQTKNVLGVYAICAGDLKHQLKIFFPEEFT